MMLIFLTLINNIQSSLILRVIFVESTSKSCIFGKDSDVNNTSKKQKVKTKKRSWFILAARTLKNVRHQYRGFHA
jgi:hypothetical protein